MNLVVASKNGIWMTTLKDVSAITITGTDAKSAVITHSTGQSTYTVNDHIFMFIN